MSAQTNQPEQIQPEIIAQLSARARERGEDINRFLRTVLDETEAAPCEPPPMSLAEVDRLLDELSEETQHVTPLAPGFSRSDIYFDHN